MKMLFKHRHSVFLFLSLAVLAIFAMNEVKAQPMPQPGAIESTCFTDSIQDSKVDFCISVSQGDRQTLNSNEIWRSPYVLSHNDELAGAGLALASCTHKTLRLMSIGGVYDMADDDRVSMSVVAYGCQHYEKFRQRALPAERITSRSFAAYG